MSSERKFDLGRTIGVLANLGVIAGIVFLGLELRQNNEFLSAEARASRFATSQGVFQPVLQNSELAVALAEAAGTDPATELKRYYFQHVLVSWEFSWNEVQLGALDADRIPIQGWAGFAQINPGFEEHWRGSNGGFNPEFVEFLDSRVFASQ